MGRTLAGLGSGRHRRTGNSWKRSDFGESGPGTGRCDPRRDHRGDGIHQEIVDVGLKAGEVQRASRAAGRLILFQPERIQVLAAPAIAGR